jgi:ketosteroid isomerase-like protein
MSIEENKSIVRRYQDAYNTGDFVELVEVVAADVLTPISPQACLTAWRVPKLYMRKHCLECRIITPELTI